LGYWQLPLPPKKHNKEWHPIVRVTQKIPFGYELDPDNDKLLLPIEHELDALELAKRHLKQYSYRAVAQWLSKETGRYISHMGLKKRIEVEQKRRKAATIKRKLAKWLQETLEEIEKLETQGVGAYAEIREDSRNIK
jgi:hypothetical protein